MQEAADGRTSNGESIRPLRLRKGMSQRYNLVEACDSSHTIKEKWQFNSCTDNKEQKDP